MRLSIVVACLMVLGEVKAQSPNVASLPLNVLPAKVADTSKPMIIYLSGDGGENEFSNEFVKALNSRGYPVVLFNSLKYFWSRKDPKTTAADIEQVIHSYASQWKKSKVILMGYSMGADVAPFVFTRLSAEKQAVIRHLVLISPSASTDFQVHVTTLFSSKKNYLSVTSEINRIAKPMLIVQGDKETEKLDINLLKGNSHSLLTLQGGHHYNSSPDVVAGNILQHLAK